MYDFDSITARVHQLLQEQQHPVSEYELIRVLTGEDVFPPPSILSGSLRLFHQHFVTMHCLYRLQQQVFPQKLEVSPLSIRLHFSPSAAASRSALCDDAGSLRTYYLDLANLEAATGDSVARLLAQFWQRFHARDEEEEAYAALGLEATASWDEVKQAYRQRAQQAHPDKGGSAEAFALVREAYQTLKQQLRSVP